MCRSVKSVGFGVVSKKRRRQNRCQNLSLTGRLLPVNTRAMTQNDINNSFDKLISFLKSRVSYCFEAKDPLKWMISTWSVKVNRSSIEKFGKPEDISKLPEATSRNSARSANLKRKRKHSEHVLYPRRQERRIA